MLKRRSRKRTLTARRHGRLRLESLEPRLLLSGNVTVTFNGGTKTAVITGDTGNNDIQITQSTDQHHITVTGLNGTTINGGAGPVTIRVKKLNVNMGNGNDKVDANFSKELRRQGTFNMGAGNDTVTVTGRAGRGLTINGGGGDDDIDVDGANVSRDLKVNGGAGADTVDVKNSTTKNTNINGGDGANNVNVDTLQTIGLTIKTGKDDDTINHTNVTAIGSITVDAGKGTNTVNGVTNTVSGNLRIEGGEMHATVTDSDVTGNVALLSETGDSTGIFNNVSGSGGFFVNFRGGNDFVTLDDSDFGWGSVKTRAGNDTFDSTNSSFLDAFEVSLGGGIDTAQFVSYDSQGRLIVRGGGEANTLNIQNSHAAEMLVTRLNGLDNQITIVDTAADFGFATHGGPGDTLLEFDNVSSSAGGAKIMTRGAIYSQIGHSSFAQQVNVNTGPKDDVLNIFDTALGGGLHGQFSGGFDGVSLVGVTTPAPVTLRDRGGPFHVFVDGLTSTAPGDALAAFSNEGPADIDILNSDLTGRTRVFSDGGPVTVDVDTTFMGDDLIIGQSRGGTATHVHNSILDGGFQSFGGRDEDRNSFDTVSIGGGVKVRSAGGSDYFISQNTTVGGRVDVLAGGGDDFLIIDNQIVESDVLLGGGPGDDIIGTNRLDIHGDAEFRGHAGNDGVSVNDTFFRGGADIILGGGNDIGAFERLQGSQDRTFFDLRVTINAGGGNDDILLGYPGDPNSGVVTLDDLIINGGPGFDTLNGGGPDATGNGNTFGVPPSFISIDDFI